MSRRTLVNLNAIATGAALVLLSSCGLSVERPDHFILLDDRGSELRLVTPDDAVLRIREFDDETERGFLFFTQSEADLEFWRKALKGELVENRGYTLLEENEIEDDRGRPGVEWVFEATTHGRPWRYLVALFERETAFGDRIRVSEYAAPKERFDEHLASVRKSVRSVSP